MAKDLNGNIKEAHITRFGIGTQPLKIRLMAAKQINIFKICANYAAVCTK